MIEELYGDLSALLLDWEVARDVAVDEVVQLECARGGGELERGAEGGLGY